MRWRFCCLRSQFNNGKYTHFDEENYNYNNKDYSNRQIDGCNKPKGEKVQSFIAIFPIFRFINAINPIRTDEKPTHHKAIDKRRRFGRTVH